MNHDEHERTVGSPSGGEHSRTRTNGGERVAVNVGEHERTRTNTAAKNADERR